MLEYAEVFDPRTPRHSQEVRINPNVLDRKTGTTYGRKVLNGLNPKSYHGCHLSYLEMVLSHIASETNALYGISFGV